MPCVEGWTLKSPQRTLRSRPGQAPIGESHAGFGNGVHVSRDKHPFGNVNLLGAWAKGDREYSSRWLGKWTLDCLASGLYVEWIVWLRNIHPSLEWIVCELDCTPLRPECFCVPPGWDPQDEGTSEQEALAFGLRALGPFDSWHLLKPLWPVTKTSLWVVSK